MYMDLSCDENMFFESPLSDPSLKRQGNEIQAMPQAIADKTLINDCRVLKNMLQSEGRVNGHSLCYFKVIQTEITPEMRTTVASWMFDVCEEEGQSKNVFLLSVNYMDRFLTLKKIKKDEFQLLASVCMLIASKWMGTILAVEKLIFYSAHSLDRETILNWEMLVLSQFKWDAFSLTPHDFVEHILHRLPDNVWMARQENEELGGQSKCFLGVGDEDSKEWKEVESQVKKFLCEMYRLGIYICPTCLLNPNGGHNFKIPLPSIVASAAIAAAIGTQVSQDVFHKIIHRLHVISKIEINLLRTAVDQLRLAVQKATDSTMANSKLSSGDAASVSNSDSDSMDHCDLNKFGKLRQADTPTDVGEIYF